MLPWGTGKNMLLNGRHFDSGTQQASSQMEMFTPQVYLFYPLLPLMIESYILTHTQTVMLTALIHFFHSNRMVHTKALIHHSWNGKTPYVSPH